MKTVRRQRQFTVGTRRALAGMALALLAQVAAPGAARAQYAFTTLDMPVYSARHLVMPAPEERA